jgi:hypothetical protein
VVEDVSAPSIEFVLVARYAEVIDRKLHVVGGGWDLLRVQGPASPCMIGLAVGIEVPWLAIGKVYTLQLRLEDEDGHELPTISGDLKIDTGDRSEDMIPGLPARAYFAANTLISFSSPGTYRIVARILGGGAGRALLHVRFGDHPRP